MMRSRNVCTVLPWDSDFFGIKIGRVIGTSLNREEVEDLRLWCEQEMVECVYFLCDPKDVDSVFVAEANGFRLVDVRVRLENRLLERNHEYDRGTGADIRPYRMENLQAVQLIAGEVHRNTRFYRDRNFPDNICDRLYQRWIQNCSEDENTRVFISSVHDVPVGYITCHRSAPSEGSIGLFGILPKYHGQRIGKQLLRHALQEFGRSGIGLVHVVTQGTSIPAQALYQSVGFQTTHVHFWFHYWPFRRSD